MRECIQHNVDAVGNGSIDPTDVEHAPKLTLVSINLFH